jgi:hypothetical protein
MVDEAGITLIYQLKHPLCKNLPELLLLEQLHHCTF